MKILLVRVIPESPRWLYTTKQTGKADKIIRKMAKVNRRELPDPLEITIYVHNFHITN